MKTNGVNRLTEIEEQVLTEEEQKNLQACHDKNIERKETLEKQ